MNKGFSLVQKNGVTLISADCINDTGMFRAFYSTGIGGVSRNIPGGCTMNLNIFKRTPDGEDCWRENFRLFCHAAEVPGGYGSLIAQREIHSSTINTVSLADRREDIFNVESYLRADGQITRDAPLFVYASDCPTLMIADSSTGVYGTVHCGWKNSLNNTIKNWIDAFKAAGGNTDTAIVAMGPSLCQDCFEVGEEVRCLFTDADSRFEKFMYRKGEKTHIDLDAVNTLQLTDEGIHPENVYPCGVCNRTELNLPSYRRDKGENGVMGGVIWLR